MYMGVIGKKSKQTKDGGRMPTTDGRRLDGYTISSSCEPNSSDELITGALKNLRLFIPLICGLKPFVAFDWLHH